MRYVPKAPRSTACVVSSPLVIGKGSPPGHSTRGRPGSYSRMTPLGSEDESAVMSGCDVTWTAPPARPQGYAMVFLLSAECGRRAARRNILVAADFTDRWGAGRRMGGRPARFAALRRLPGPGAMDPGVPTQIGRRARPLHHTCGFTNHTLVWSAVPGPSGDCRLSIGKPDEEAGTVR